MWRTRLGACVAALLLVASLIVAYVATSPQAGAVTAVPRPDHVVIVVDENRAQSIIGDSAAPYITQLAGQNADFTQSYAITHPSQPNYLALFSGSTQGVTTDDCPQTFSTPNLASSLIASGATFAGYSEDLPSPGYTGCQSANYARKHNPWADWPAVPASANLPFTAFPTDFSTLPDVSIIVPNLQDDMHDGSVAMGDAWLQSNMDSYITWAKTHNSLFILTFDEDDNADGNLIPTVFAGQRVTPGNYAETITHYNVLRTVEDAYGVAPIEASSTASPVLDVWTPDQGNTPPTAAFSSACTQLACSFDGSASTDPDGTISNYAWTFGDNATGTGQTAAHTYGASATYNVTLTVTDNLGQSTVTTKQVPVSGPAPPPLASDSFNRTVASGLGNADVGGAWTTTGAATSLSVSPDSANWRLGTNGTTSTGFLRSVSSTDTDLLTVFSYDKAPNGSGVYFSAVGRSVAQNTDYRALVLMSSTGVTVTLRKTIANVNTTLATKAVAGMVVTPGQTLSLRVQVTGTNPTTIRSRIWPTASAEPTTWTASITDSTSVLQAAGWLGYNLYLSSSSTSAPVTVKMTSMLARPTSTAPVNQLPVASFTTACTLLTCSVDAGATTDADGTIASYAWQFGDTTTGTGVTTTHTYAAGTYTITLTVTDNSGGISSTTRAVTVSGPVNQLPVASFTTACTLLTCSVDAGATTDADGTIASYAWQFGDTTTGTGVTTTHTYAAGTYTITLTVTDNSGGSSSTTRAVTVSGPVNQPFASDAFGRTVANGWGSSTSGGAWTVTGTAANFSVSAGLGSILFPSAGSTRTAYLLANTRTDADVVVAMNVSNIGTGSGLTAAIVGRLVSSGNDYRATARFNPAGTITLTLSRVIAGTATNLGTAITIPGLTYGAGTSISVRVQVTGTAPTTVRARAWLTGATEPTTWAISATDLTVALQMAGSVGLVGYLASNVTNAPTTWRITSFIAKPTA